MVDHFFLPAQLGQVQLTVPSQLKLTGLEVQECILNYDFSSMIQSRSLWGLESEEHSGTSKGAAVNYTSPGNGSG